MRLFHISEDPHITVFEPRPSNYTEKAVVWAIDSTHIHNYFLPRDCPRVTYYALPDSHPDDVTQFLGSSRAVVAVEGKWLNAIQTCRLTLYHMSTAKFQVLDKGAGYWVCEHKVVPQSSSLVTDCLAELAKRQIEIRILPELWSLRDAILESSLQFSFIRMRNAQPRRETIKD